MMKALVFDLDDTLYPEWQFAASGFAAVGEWLQTHRDISGFAYVAEEAFKAGIRRNVFNVALDRMEVQYERNLISKLVNVYRSHRPSIQLFDDARWALDAFPERLALGLITDGYYQTQRNKVEALGIASVFTKMVFSDAYGPECWKPSFVPYQRMASELSLEGKECAYVGDNPTKDFVTAKKLGWLTVQVCRAEGEYRNVDVPVDHHAEVKIFSLRNLETIL